MEILSKNNIGICFYFKFSSVESLLFQLYCGSFFRKDMKINSLQGFNPTKCPPRRSLSIKNKKEQS